MKFIKELIASKSWNADQDAAKFGEDDVRRDLEEGGFKYLLIYSLDKPNLQKHDFLTQLVDWQTIPFQILA